MEATQRVIDGLRAAAANRPMNLAHIQPADDDVISSLANVGYILLRHYTARSIKRVSNLFSFSSHFQHSARARDQRPRRILAIPNTPNTILPTPPQRVNNIILLLYVYTVYIYIYTRRIVNINALRLHVPSATHPRRRRLTRENIKYDIRAEQQWCERRGAPKYYTIFTAGAARPRRRGRRRFSVTTFLSKTPYTMTYYIAAIACDNTTKRISTSSLKTKNSKKRFRIF